MPPRVVSLLPSATEQLALAGGLDLLVGRSHECDYPAQAASAPILTASRLTFESSKQIDYDVSQALSAGESLYTIDAEKLQALKPDIILTQDICSVCSIDMAAVQRTAKKMVPEPTVVSLDPAGLKDVLSDLLKVGAAVGLEQQAQVAHDALQARIDQGLKVAAEASALRARKQRATPKVAFLEWTEPAYVGGHWTPELIEMAGGSHPLNPAGSDKSGGAGKSFAVHSQKIVDMDPDIIIWSPCGLNLDETESEVERLLQAPEGGWFLELRAVKEGRVAAVDGNQMFNRPGPRLVDAFEWLVWYINGGADGAAVPPHLASFPWRKWTVPRLSAPAPVPIAKPTTERQWGHPINCPEGGFSVDIEEAHWAAVVGGKDTYTDPRTGYMVFTEEAARKRGYCCGRGCRHCPYGHFNVQEKSMQKNLVRTAVLLHNSKRRKEMEQTDHLNIVFWSGGKDSYMALKKVQSECTGGASKIVLLTTYTGSTNIVPEQNINTCQTMDQAKALGLEMMKKSALVRARALTHNINTRQIMDQAKALGLELMLVPLPEEGCGNDAYVETVGEALQRLLAELGHDSPESRQNVSLVFGDLHLQDIREWREKSMGPNSSLKMQLKFPLFGLPYAELPRLLFGESGQVKVRISAVSERGPAKGVLEVGQTFDAKLIDSLSQDGRVDAFGERGEFHTEVLLS